MQIVLPGALPDPAAAKALVDHLADAAPTLCRWLGQARPKLVTCNPGAAGCTALEHFQLEQAGFKPHVGQPFGAGLGPLRCTRATEPGQAVWLAELAHVAATQEGAVLLPAHRLGITPPQSVALFESAQALFAGTGFQLFADTPAQWRVTVPPGFQMPSISPALVSSTTVNEWWLHDAASRPWRQLFNELQMLWFTAPANLERQSQGELPINALWLYGGATPSQLSASLATADAQHIYTGLDQPARSRDWGAWLDALRQLETQVFKPLSGQATPNLVLLGDDRRVEALPRPLARWLRWPGRTQTWRKWWLHQN